MIPYGDIRKSAPANDTPRDREARRRAAAAINLFGGPAGQNGVGLDFSKPGAPAMPTSGTGSLADLYQPAFRAEIAAKATSDARADKLMPAVRQLAQSHGLDLEALEVINIAVRNCAILGGEATVYASDAGRAVGIGTQLAEAILADAVRRGLLEERSGSRFRSKI